MQLIIVSSARQLSETATQVLIDELRNWQPKNDDDRFVLGLPTGSTPITMYQMWQQYSQEGRLDFRKIITFNMDEYVGLSSDHPQSYAYFMHQQLFNGLLFPPAEIHLLDGAAKNVEEECEHYEKEIARCDGIDLFFGGVGTQGHVAFNEAYSSFFSRTRRVSLSSQTRLDNARWFDNKIAEEVPTHALSVGLGTLLEAKKLTILALGPEKSAAVARGLEGPITHQCPLSILQLHPNALLICDEDAAQQISPETREFLVSL